MSTPTQKAHRFLSGSGSSSLRARPSYTRASLRLFSQLSALAEEYTEIGGKQQTHKVANSTIASKSGVVDSGTAAIRVSHYDAPHCGTIRKIELNRPRAKNAINQRLLTDLGRELEDIHAESSAGQTRALIVASGLSDVFCAGADLKERKTMNEREVEDFLHSLRYTFTRLATLPIPTIACVSGAALGGGLELALCCDLRVFSDSAVVGLPETRLAIIPGAGGTHRLSQAIGLSGAKDLILTGRRVGAEEAHRMGLCHRLVPNLRASDHPQGEADSAYVQAEALNFALDIARGGPVAIRAALEAIRGGNQEAENNAYKKVLKTNDRMEALAAFTGKRSAVFKGE